MYTLHHNKGKKNVVFDIFFVFDLIMKFYQLSMVDKKANRMKCFDFSFTYTQEHFSIKVKLLVEPKEEHRVLFIPYAKFVIC